METTALSFRRPAERREGEWRGVHPYRAVLFAALLVAAGLLFAQLMTLLVAVLITVVISIPPAALATRLERRGVPRVVGVALGFAVGIGVFAGALALVIPALVRELGQFAGQLPRVVHGQAVQSFLEGYAHHPARLLGPIASVGLSFLTVAGGIVFVLVTAFYVAWRPEPLVRGALRLLPPARRVPARGVMRRLRSAWLGWMKGVAADMLISGVLLYVGLSLAGLHFALLFSVFTALMVVVPTFGGFISGVPPVLYALTYSPTRALLILGIYLAQQQIEGNLILPLIMARTTKLHPAVIAIGVVVVADLFGVVGLFIAVPIISACVILTEEIWVKPRERRSAMSGARPPSHA